MGLVDLGNRSYQDYKNWYNSPEGKQASAAESQRVQQRKASGGAGWLSSDGVVQPPTGWNTSQPGGGSQSSPYGAYNPGQAQPSQSPYGNSTPYGQPMGDAMMYRNGRYEPYVQQGSFGGTPGGIQQAPQQPSSPTASWSGGGSFGSSASRYGTQAGSSRPMSGDVAGNRVRRAIGPGLRAGYRAGPRRS